MQTKLRCTKYMYATTMVTKSGTTSRTACYGPKRTQMYTHRCKRYITVLGIFFFAVIGAKKLWVSFGAGKKLRYIPNHHVCNTMSPA